MRRELDLHGQEIFTSDKMLFSELAKSYETRMSPAVFQNGIKISSRKSSIDWIVNSLVEYFGSKQIRSIKPRDLETFKNFKLGVATKQGTKRKIASVNRELEVLRAMLNFALQNEWIIKNPFTMANGLIFKAAEVERNRILTFDEENRLENGFQTCRCQRLPFSRLPSYRDNPNDCIRFSAHGSDENYGTYATEDILEIFKHYFGNSK